MGATLDLFIMVDVSNLNRYIYIQGVILVYFNYDIGIRKDNRSNDYYNQSCQIVGNMFLIFVRIIRTSPLFQSARLEFQAASRGGF